MKLANALAVLSVAFATSVAAAETGSIAAVNAPLAYFARVLAAPEIEIIYLIPEDADPADWSPTTDEILIYQQADLILLNGAGYAAWVKTEVLPRARLIDTSRQVQDKLIPAGGEAVIHKHGLEGERTHSGSFAITTWLDLTIAEAQMEAVAEAISLRWPDLAPKVAERSEDLRAELLAANRIFETFFGALKGRQVLASHPVYQYLDQAYLDGITAHHWEPGVFPNAEEWAGFTRQLTSVDRPIMLWEDDPVPETKARLSELGVEILVFRTMANNGYRGDLIRALATQLE